MNTLKHIRAILLLPVMVTLIIPGVILHATGTLNIGRAGPPPLNFMLPLLGVLLIGFGLTLVVKTNVLFIKIGKGTLAPWDATQKLVVHGPYRYVRNPMISGVFCILLGESAMLGSGPLFCWFLFFLALNLVYTPLFEERDLERRLGEEYRVYKKHVPRWIPRLRPWEKPSDKGNNLTYRS